MAVLSPQRIEATAIAATPAAMKTTGAANRTSYLVGRARLAQWLLAAGLFVSAVSGCATFRSYQFELGRTLDLVSAGEIETALEVHQRHAPRRKDLLYFLERGELLRLAGRHAESQQAWFEADRRVAEWEEQVRMHPEMLLRDAGSLLVNDRMRAYQGHDFEKVMLTTRMALNHLALGEWDQARVAIKRTHEREALIAALRAQQLRETQEAAGEQGERRDFRDLNGYPVETIDSPEVRALRNSYQNAFSHYLAGFLYEALGEISLAAAGYRQAIELQPGIALLEEGLAGLDSRHARRRAGADRSAATTDLLVVVETGLAPARRSVKVDLPVLTDQGVLLAPVSFPALDPRPGPPGARGVLVNQDVHARGADIASVDLMARRALLDEMPWIMVRAITRAAAKVSLQKAAFKSDDSGVAGAAAMIGAIITEQADERAWRSLPADIAVARLRLATGEHDIDVEIGSSTHRFSVMLDGPFAVMSVRQVGTAVYMSLTPGRYGSRQAGGAGPPLVKAVQEATGGRSGISTNTVMEGFL